MLQSCLNVLLLCIYLAHTQVLKFSLRWEVSSVVPPNSTTAVELSYRPDNQFSWTKLASFQAEYCPCGPQQMAKKACGDTQLNLAGLGVDATRPIQFRWLQRGPSPYIWSLDTVSFDGSIYDDFNNQLYPNGDRWCDVSVGTIAASTCPAIPPQSSLTFCANCQKTGGAMTPLLFASGLVTILQQCRKDVDVLELLETPRDTYNCSKDKAPMQITFLLYIGPSNNSLDTKDAILLSMRTNTSLQWIPLHMYASGTLDYPWCGPNDCRIAFNGYNISVSVHKSQVFGQIQEHICASLLNKQLQFMWSGMEGNRVVWALGNVSIGMHYPSFCLLLSEDFRTSAHIASTLQEIKGGSVHLDPLNGGQVSFIASNSSPAAVTVPTDLSCPQPNTAPQIPSSPPFNSTQRCPQEIILDYLWPNTKEGVSIMGHCVQGRYNASRRCAPFTAWSAQWESVNCSSPVNINDPDLALLDLCTLSSVLEPSETMDLMKAITEVLGNYSANEVFGEQFISIASNVVNRATRDDQPMGTLDGSEFLQTMDYFALWTQNVSRNVTTFESENIVLNISSVFRDVHHSQLVISCGANNITLPAKLMSPAEQHEHVRVAAYCFYNISPVLADPSSDMMTASPVLSASLNCTQCQTDNLEVPVVISFGHSHLQSELLTANYSTICVYWQFERTDNGTLSGHWSHDGCVKDTSLSSSITTVCACSHLTHFAILLSPNANISQKNNAALFVIQVVGTIISLIALAATIITFALLRSLWSLRNYVHINLCISLFVSQLVLLAVEGVQGKVLCAVVAVILQYLFLVVFMWMLMEGAVLYLALVVVFTASNTKYMIYFALASYGLPAVYLCAIVPVGFLVTDQSGRWQYGTQNCWLRYDTHFIWSFIAPVLLVIMVNVVIFVLAMGIMWRHHHSKTRAVDTKHWLRVSVSLTIVLGFTWIFGMLYFNKYLVFFAYIFTVCNTLQGLFIFIFIVILSKQIRDEYARWWKNAVMQFVPLRSNFIYKPSQALANSRRTSKSNQNPNKSRTMSTTTTCTKGSPDHRLSIVLAEDPSPRNRCSLGSIGYDVDMDMEVFEIVEH